MKYAACFVMLSLCIPYVVGCGEKGPDATDSAFENNLSKAEAAHKGAAGMATKGRKLPPQVAARMGAGTAPAPASGTEVSPGATGVAPVKTGN